MDIAFDLCGNRLATASQDCTSRIVDCKADFKELALIEGHNDEISKVNIIIIILPENVSVTNENSS